MSTADLQQQAQPTTSSLTEPVVLCAADERYAMPLAVTIVSAAENLALGSSLNVTIVDGGISNESRRRLLESLDGYPITVNFVEACSVDLTDLKTSHHISHTAYLRLLADRWLPNHLEKCIYLDSDLVVLSSLTEIWEQPIGDFHCLAVPDVACPFVDARRGAAPEFRKSLPYLASWQPIPNYDELGVNPQGNYFNSGVMVINLERWRAERLGERMLEVLRAHAEHVWCWDQYALNSVCSGRWGQLPLEWNVGAHAFEFPGIEHSPFSPGEFQQMITRPAVMHFTTEFKPWDHHCTHPRRELFFEYLDKTAWRGWRPEKPRFRLRDWWTRQAVSVVKHCTIGYRKFVLARAGQ